MDRHEEEAIERASFGFWIYLMTDLLMFAVLFATYIVLHNNTFGGPSGADLFDLRFVLVETMVLLTSSFACGLGSLALRRGEKNRTLLWFSATFVLGCAFLAMEFAEFSHLLSEGQSWTKSAFLSSYFTLVGTHGLHITVGLLWMAVGIAMILARGLNEKLQSQMNRLSIFWHFLDLVWIFIFTIVYLIGAVQ